MVDFNVLELDKINQKSSIIVQNSWKYTIVLSKAPLLNFGKPTSQWLTLGAPPSSSVVTPNSTSTKTSNLLTWTYKSDGSTQLSKQLQVGT